MRGVSTKWVRVVLAALVLSVPVWADEAPPTDPPQARIQPPVGVTSQWRVQPPVGVTSQARMQPPVGAPESSLFALVKLWLKSRLSVPNG